MQIMWHAISVCAQGSVSHFSNLNMLTLVSCLVLDKLCVITKYLHDNCSMVVKPCAMHVLILHGIVELHYVEVQYHPLWKLGQ